MTHRTTHIRTSVLDLLSALGFISADHHSLRTSAKQASSDLAGVTAHFPPPEDAVPTKGGDVAALSPPFSVQEMTEGEAHDLWRHFLCERGIQQ